MTPTTDTYRCTECGHEFQHDCWPVECPSCRYYHCGDDEHCTEGYGFAWVDDEDGNE